MPRQIVRLVLAVLILASLFGGRSLIANTTDGSQHVVKPGETLSGIAAQYGLTVDQLASLNGITEPNRLTEGQALKLPPSTTARAPTAPVAGSQPPAQASAPASAKPAAAPPSEYVVKSGDTLGEIAKALGITLRALMEANTELADPDRLKIGQKLAVPAGATPPTPAVPAARSTQPGQPSTSTASAPASASAAAPSDDASAALDRLAQQYAVDPALVRALAWIETDGKPMRLDSPGGVGYLTVTEKTFEYIQQTLVKRTLERANPTDNLEAGIAYVASMLKWGGDEPMGLAGFLQGPGSVRTNGVRPAIDEQVKRILALRDRLKSGAPAPRTAANGSGAGPAAPPATPKQTAPASSAPAASSPPQSIERKPWSGDATATLTARAISAARAVAGQQARIGVSGRNLVSGEGLGIAAHQTFPAASVGKLALLVEAYRQSTSGTLTLTDGHRADLRAMIVSSDNEAANRLMEVLTTRTVNANLQVIGLASTRLGNPFGLARAAGNPANVTTPGDMMRLMELLATEQLVSAQASREIRGLLLQSHDGSKIRRGLPPEARLAHKSGWYDGVANDVGIVTHGQGSYILSVFTEGIDDPETANQTIAAIAQAVHGVWGPSQSNGATAAAQRTR